MEVLPPRYMKSWQQSPGRSLWLISGQFSGGVSRLLILLCIGCGTSATPDPPVPVSRIELEPECERVAQRMRDALGDRGEVVVRVPFVLAGDGAARELIARYQQQIEPLARAMRLSYFEKVPDRPITFLLCSQTGSYRDLARHLFADEPVSKWGYYKPSRHTVVVNLERGPAGIGHELTHALMDFDFPAAPFWFREGLAALHESVVVRETAEGVCLEGLREGRWKAIQTLLENDRLLTLGTLLRVGKPRPGRAARRYAQARFFCLYLQRRRQLKRYYQRFKRAGTADPHGTRTLLEVLGKPDLEAVDFDFRGWLETLSEKPATRADATSLDERS